MKSNLEAKTDPGGAAGYKIQVITHDPGTEFEGAMREVLQKDKVINGYSPKRIRSQKDSGQKDSKPKGFEA